MKPWVHSEMCAKRWGGTPENYLDINNWFDETKGWIADSRHRAIRHHSQGIFECEKIFGNHIINSQGRKVSVRDIGEYHVLSDFAGKFIPTAQDYLQNMELQGWMNNGQGVPPSYSKIEEQKAKIRESKKPVPRSLHNIVLDGAKNEPSQPVFDDEAKLKLLDGIQFDVRPNKK